MSKPIYRYDIEQNSDEWFDIKIGKFSASSAPELLMDKSTKGYKGLIAKIVEERITGQRCESNQFKGNWATERGHEFEPIAREDYELRTLQVVKTVGVVELNEWTLCSPDGLIQFDGETINTITPDKRVRMGIVQVMEGRRIFEHLTVLEHLLARGQRQSRTVEKRNMDTVFGYFPKLRKLCHNVAGYLSGGEQQMLVIGRALMLQPKLMLLDEPSLGLAPLVADDIFSIISRINAEEKTSVLLVEQNAMAALDVAHYGYIMETGKIVLDGPADKMKNNKDVQEFYMGLSELGKKSYRTVKHYKRRKRWLA